MKVPVIETERLTLREFRLSDFDRFAEMKGDPDVMKYLADGLPMAREVAWRVMASEIGHWDLLGFGHWAVEERNGGAFVGAVGLFEPLGWPGLEAGWQLHRSAWGRGYATEAARASLTFAWRQLGADHVISMIDPANAASIKVAEKIGQHLQGQMNFHGHLVLVYGIDRPDVGFGDMWRVFRGWKSRRRWRDWKERNAPSADPAYKAMLEPVGTNPDPTRPHPDEVHDMVQVREVRPLVKRLFAGLRGRNRR